MHDEEWFWRKKIAREILRYCDHSIEPCLDCQELSVVIRNGGRLELWKISGNNSGNF